jgi:hypothetical protein
MSLNHVVFATHLQRQHSLHPWILYFLRCTSILDTLVGFCQWTLRNIILLNPHIPFRDTHRQELFMPVQLINPKNGMRRRPIPRFVLHRLSAGFPPAVLYALRILVYVEAVIFLRYTLAESALLVIPYLVYAAIYCVFGIFGVLQEYPLF